MASGGRKDAYTLSGVDYGQMDPAKLHAQALSRDSLLLGLIPVDFESYQRVGANLHM